MIITSRTRTIVLCVLLTAVAGCRGDGPTTGGGPDAPQGGVPGAPPSIRLVADVSRGEWRMPSGDYGNLRYSTLDTITTKDPIPLQRSLQPASHSDQ